MMKAFIFLWYIVHAIQRLLLEKYKHEVWLQISKKDGWLAKQWCEKQSEGRSPDVAVVFV